MAGNTRTLVGLGIGAGIAAYALAHSGRRRFRFRDRVVVITGGSRGLGLVLARQLAEQGARLALLARDADELARAADQVRDIGAEVLCLSVDVTEREQVEDAIQRIVDHYGQLDVLINNAGIIQVGPLEHMTIDDFQDAMNLHLYAPLYATLAAWPHLRRSAGARIVNIASIGGKIAVPHLLPYTTSKFALVGLSDGLRTELDKYGIKVTTVCPGPMRTGSPPNAFYKGQHRKEYAWFAINDALPGASISVERAARQIIAACGRGQARLIVSWPARLATLLSELLPGLTAQLTELVDRWMPDPDPRRGVRKWSGWQSASELAPSRLTRLSDRATEENNETGN